jgi:hypothetical protein
VVASLLLLLPASATAQPGAAADVCLEVAAEAVDAAAWTALSEAVADATAERTALFPAATITTASHEALLEAAAPSLRLEIDAGHAAEPTEHGAATCLEPGLDWGARFGRVFLEAGADRMLAEAPTTPGIESSVAIEWHADDDRLQTTLVFAGPLDIPNGTCWIDDRLSIDADAGVAIASGEQGVKTSIFAEGACRRFFDHLPDGGAGGQAVTLLPLEVTAADGATLRFIATEVRVTEDAVVVGGALEPR